MYFFEERVIGFSKNVQASARGELEITDVINQYLKFCELDVELMGCGTACLDTGTHDEHPYGIGLILNKGRLGEDYNLGGNNEWANFDIVKEVCNLLEQAFKSDSSLASRYPLALSVIVGNAESHNYLCARLLRP